MFSESRWEDKIWGRVHHIFASLTAAVSCLEVDKGFQCSIHRHKDRINQFTILEGSVCIEHWPTGLDNPSIMKVLLPGDTRFMHNGIWHRFRVIRSGRIIEVYWSGNDMPVRWDDIERIDEGGPFDLDELEAELNR